MLDFFTKNQPLMRAKGALIGLLECKPGWCGEIAV